MSTAATLPIYGATATTWDLSDTSIVQDPVQHFDHAWATSAIYIPNPNTFISSPTFTAAPSLWFHYELFMVSFDGPSNVLVWQILDGATVVADCHVSGTVVTYVWTFRTLQSGVLTTVGTVTTAGQVLNRFDIGLVGGSSNGSLTVASAGTIYPGFPVFGLNHAGFSGVTQVKPAGGNAPFEGAWWSQTCLDTVSTIGRQVLTVSQNTVSAVNTSWVATIPEVAKTTNSDSTFASSPSAGQNASFYQSTLNLAGFNVLGIGVGLRIKREDSSGPQNAKHLIRSAGANFNGPNISSVTTGYQAAFYGAANDPATSAPWTPSGAAEAETGMTSAA